MNPSQFNKHPYDSAANNAESEVVARNIMVILGRTGDQFRQLTWEEYKSERIKDGNFTEREKQYFQVVVQHCASAENALRFCPHWIN
jgi:hypothetical protein